MVGIVLPEGKSGIVLPEGKSGILSGRGKIQSEDFIRSRGKIQSEDFIRSRGSNRAGIMRKIFCWLGIHKWAWHEWVSIEPSGYCYIHGPCVRCGREQGDK